MEKHLGRKMTAVLLAGSLLLAVLPAQAQEQNTPKEEVVYATLYSDGAVQGVYVVNSFVLDEAGKILYCFAQYDFFGGITFYRPENYH